MIRAPFSCTEIGTWLAHADNNQQAEVLNALGRELPIACRSETSSQLCWFAAELDKHGENLVTELADYVKLRKDEG